MNYKVRYDTSSKKSLEDVKGDSLYTEFGTYITSITPYHFSCKMAMLIFQDRYRQQDPRCHMISFVDGHDNDPSYEIAAYADFSGNQEVEFDPILYSTDIRDGLFEQKEVDFQFLTFSPIYFKHEFEIPLQYLSLIQPGPGSSFLNGSTIVYDPDQNKITVSTMKNFSYGAIHGNANAMPTSFSLVFGNTDSSYIYMYKGVELPEDKRFPFWDQDGWVLIRSDKFITLNIRMPAEGQTNTMYSTISFNTDGLIQVYAGNDNIPYTSDDLFIYAPCFWERVKVKLETIEN